MSSKIGVFKGLVLVVFVSFACLIFLVTFTVTLILILKSVLRNESDISKGRIGRYRYFQFQSTRNRSTVGLVSFPEHLMTGDYISYDDEFGNTNVVSKIGSTEYHCTGVCSCSDERRYSGTILKKGLSYIVAALTSSVVAYELAKEHFDEECKQTFKDDCLHSEKVSSELIECVKEIKSNEEDTTEHFLRYWCFGHCLDKKSDLDPKKRLELQNKVLYGDECKDIVGEAPVLIPDNDQTRFHEKMDLAKVYFVRYHLNTLCKFQSYYKGDFEYLYELGNYQREVLKGKFQSFLCRGSHDGTMENESVGCVRTS